MRKRHGKTFAAAFWLASSALLFVSFAQQARAQSESSASAPEPEGAPSRRGPSRRNDDAAGLLMQLNLSPDQRAQLVEISRQNAPEAQQLGRRLNQARLALDAAIYADDVDEATVEERLREVAVAQAAVVRMRALTELRVRRVLTPEQLKLFRQLRREAFLRRRLGRRARQGDRADDRPPRPERPLSDDEFNRRPNNPTDSTRPNPDLSPRLRRPKP